MIATMIILIGMMLLTILKPQARLIIIILAILSMITFYFESEIPESYKWITDKKMLTPIETNNIEIIQPMSPNKEEKQ